jgi:uncharacterized protein (TIGR04255 family)
MVQLYKAPPILEAVVEFRFSESVNEEDISKKLNKFKRNYSEHTNNIEVSTEMSVNGVSSQHKKIGYRCKTPDQLQIMIVNVNLVSISQLAPYPGWSEFCARVMRDLDTNFEVLGRRKISRIGMRYINRIDVPDRLAKVSDYLNIYPVMPDIGRVGEGQFAIQTTQQLEGGRFGVTIQSASVPSPVPQSTSFLLDIDISTTLDIPSKSDHICNLLNEMRISKNSMFEALIKESSRGLFN